MSKYVIVSIISVLVGYIGIAIKGIYVRRKRILSDYDTFLGEIIEEISYNKAPLVEIVHNCMTGKSKQFVALLLRLEESISGKYYIEVDEKYLKARENKIIQNCFNALGKKSVTAEIESLNNERRQSVAMSKRASDDYEKKGSLIAKLAILLALALLILMV